MNDDEAHARQEAVRETFRLARETAWASDAMIDGYETAVMAPRLRAINQQAYATMRELEAAHRDVAISIERCDVCDGAFSTEAWACRHGDRTHEMCCPGCNETGESNE
jgi:hypothetical protein